MTNNEPEVTADIIRQIEARLMADGEASSDEMMILQKWSRDCREGS